MIRGFIRVATEAGPILLGIAQIVSISHGLTKRGRSTDIRMGDGSTCVAVGSVDDVINLIEDAEFGPEPEEAAPVAAPKPSAPNPALTQTYTGPTTGETPSGLGGTYPPQMDETPAAKKRGRPPKATPQQ